MLFLSCSIFLIFFSFMNRWNLGGIPEDEMEWAGNGAIYCAAVNYDASMNVPLSGYASFCVKNHIKNMINHYSRSIWCPPQIQKAHQGQKGYADLDNGARPLSDKF